MNRIIPRFTIALVFMLVFGNVIAQSTDTKLIVLYFHATHRCHTCSEIERMTTLLLDESFSDKLASGEIVFKSIDYEDPANKEIVDKYYAYGSTLILVNPMNENLNKELTDMAFQWVVNKPQKYLQDLAREIQILLKQE